MTFNRPFGINSLDDAWVAVGKPTTTVEDRWMALTVLAMNCNILPGLVFFEIPSDADPDIWRELREASMQACGCPSRRLLLPGRGRSRLRPLGEPQRLMLSEVNVPSHGERLLLIPHGGDAATAYLLWRWEAEVLVTDMSPCLEAPACWQVLHDSRVDPYGFNYSANYLGVELLNRGEIDCRIIVMDRLVLPVCSIVDFGGTPWRAVTIELDAGVQALRLKAGEPLPRHICQP